ncbi:hypothetical protein NQ317_015130 [Molorchus minor]|uniref:Uncharacterized protein n=1 Tax=Molorchus minor TaxID=1323400 RepID=A0ABQ9K664_9CUCU|nr:hypothetical protein NQ317_015130 [Molorchus minor]
MDYKFNRKRRNRTCGYSGNHQSLSNVHELTLFFPSKYLLYPFITGYSLGQKFTIKTAKGNVSQITQKPQIDFLRSAFSKRARKRFAKAFRFSEASKMDLSIALNFLWSERTEPTARYLSHFLSRVIEGPVTRKPLAAMCSNFGIGGFKAC